MLSATGKFPGRPWAIPDAQLVASLLAKPGDRRDPSTQPLSRVKEDRMRVFPVVLALLSISAFAADVTVKVVDPLSAAVAGAQVQLIAAGDSRILATQTTSAEGTATLHTASTGSTQIRVLAPGFA